MREQNRNTANSDIARQVIARAEADFRTSVQSVGEAICERDGLRFLTLSGPTCSGKTTTAEILKRTLADHGKRISVISLDDFYRDSSHVDRLNAARDGGAIDYDSPDTMNIPLLHDCIETIFCGEQLQLPVFDFRVGRAETGRHFDPRDCDIILFEGIQAVYPQISSLFPQNGTFRISIYPREKLKCNGIVFSPRTVRLIRRIVRDYKFRCAEPEFTLYLWDSVTANEDTFILPYLDAADFCIDSLLDYEVNAARDFILPILERVPSDSPMAARAQALAEAVSRVQSLDAELIPSDSLYREFIGNK